MKRNEAKMKNNKIIIWSIVVIIAAVLGYYFYTKNQTQAISWKTSPVQSGDISLIVTSTGSISADTTVQVGTQVSGVISSLYADWNTVVKKGQLIAMIDTTFLAATKEDAMASMEKAQLEVHQMKTEYDRTKLLYDSLVLPRADYDVALTNYKSAQSSVKSANSLLRRAKINLKYAKITAPISGKIISRNVDVGQTVIASFNTPTLFTIANDLSKMQVQANVDEADIGEVKVGQQATFTVDAFPNETFSGKILQIRLLPNVIQNVVNYTVIINAPNKALKLMPGLTANINIIVQKHNNILKVPANSFHFIPPAEYYENDKTLPDSIKIQFKSARIGSLSEGDQAFLWIKQDETIIPHKVTIGITDGSFTEVSGNLKVNDIVILGISKEKTAETTTKNPFMPSMPARKTR